jgi:hypothetical protein
MPITRKQQLLAQTEATEGGGPPTTFSGTDAVQVYDPSISDSVDLQDRVPSGSTLSRDFVPIGRKSREITFTSDLRGSGGTGAPDFATFLPATGYKAATLTKATLGAVTGGLGFQLGEQVTQSGGTIKGVCVGVFNAAHAPILRGATATDYIIIAQNVGTFVTAAATAGSSSTSLSTLSALGAHVTGHGFQPTSEKLVNVTNAAWSGGPTSAIAGDVLRVEDILGNIVGAVQIITVNTTDVDFDVTLLWGEMLDTHFLGDGTNTADITAVAQTRTTSLAMLHNFDGRNRALNGARGSFSMQGEVGTPVTFTWNFSGDIGTDADAVPLVSSGLGTVRAPRLLGAKCVYGLGVNDFQLPTKSMGFDNGGVVSPNLDANSAGGSTGANVTDRDSSFTVTVDIAHSSLDWEAARDNGTVLRVGFLLGTVLGNIVSVVAPNCQVTEVSLSDSDGVGVFDVTLKPRRIAESGDDDVYICQL